MDELYYAHPVQVRFWDTNQLKYVGGIAYHDYIICACCGEALRIDEILDLAMKMSKLDPDKAIVELAWIDISQEILGV